MYIKNEWNFALIIMEHYRLSIGHGVPVDVVYVTIFLSTWIESSWHKSLTSTTWLVRNEGEWLRAFNSGRRYFSTPRCYGMACYIFKLEAQRRELVSHYISLAPHSELLKNVGKKRMDTFWLLIFLSAAYDFLCVKQNFEKLLLKRNTFFSTPGTYFWVIASPGESTIYVRLLPAPFLFRLVGGRTDSSIA